MKYIAFGIGYKDQIGTIIEESENYYIVEAQGAGLYKLALYKKFTEVFDTAKERDEWIKNQNYRYDPR
jgi:hypothetical protein